MGFRKRLGIYLIGLLFLASTPKGIEKCSDGWNNYKVKCLRKDIAFMKTFELADTDYNCLISSTELSRVKILSGVGPNFKKGIGDLRLGEYETYLSKMGYEWRNGNYNQIR